MITKSWLGWCWQLGLTGSLALVGAIAAGVGDRTRAQIAPDTTLEAESSVVTPNVFIRGLPSDQIDGGAIRATNLFHSFEQFNIDEGRGAYFTNPAGIENILSRVTGGNRSEILGTLGVLGNANLFLLNPNGIIFGPSSSLDVGGSFVATTANAIQFSDQGFFSASVPNIPSPLLVVNPSAFLFNQITAGSSIENRSTASAGLDPSGAFDTFGLKVPDGRSLLLLGGDVSINGGGIVAFGGRVDLAGVAGAGTVGLNLDANNQLLSFPESIARADVSLTNGAGVIVAAGEGGSIAINARNVDVLGGSRLTAGIGGGLGTVGSQAGDITLNATEAVTVANGFIFNDVNFGAVGNAGNLTIETKQLSISDGGQVGTVTSGEGNAGNLTVDASDSVEPRGDNQQSTTGLFVQVAPTGIGNGGDLTIETGRLSVSNGAEVNNSTLGVGDSGNLTIEAERLSVSDGAQVATSTAGLGNAGNLTVHASDSVELRGDGPLAPGGLFAQVNITLEGKTGTGDGGKLTIETRRLSVSDGSKVQVSTFGDGDAGDLLIQADVVEVFGTPIANRFTTGVFAEVADPSPAATGGIPGDAERKARGDGGNLTIEAERLSIRDGGIVSASTLSDGNAGRLVVRARDSVEVVGTSAESGSPSLLIAGVVRKAKGNGGDLTIETGRLSIRNGARVSVSTSAEGNAGALRVHATESVEVIGTSADGQNHSELSAAVRSGGTGSGGSLTIETEQLSVRDRAILTSRSEGQRSAGNVAINVRGTLQANNGEISTSSTRSGGGNININAGDIRLQGDSDITTSVFSGVGSGGDINLTANSIIALDDSDILAFAQNEGGDVTLNTPAFFGFRYQPASPGTDPDTLDGNDRVDINASGAVAGVIILPDVSFIQNSLTELPENLIDTNSLIANSCIARSNQQGGTFVITGAGGLPMRPGDASVSPYPTGTVRTVPSSSASSNSPSSVSGSGAARPWQIGEPIVEPQGVYRLADGQLVISRECSQ